MVIQNTPYITVSHVQNMMAFTSSWHLSRIKSPNNDDEITFSYTNESQSYMTSHAVDVVDKNLDVYTDSRHRNSQNEFVTKVYLGTLSVNMGSNILVDEPGEYTVKLGTNQQYNVGYRFMPQNVILTTSYASISAKRLVSIVTAVGHRADFLANSDRYDLLGSKRLDNIEIFNNENTLVKSTVFDYDFTVSDVPTDVLADNLSYWYWFDTDQSIAKVTEYGHIPGTSANTVYNANWYQKWKQMVEGDYWRMFLRKITDSYGTNRDIETYRFNYNFGNLTSNGEFDNVLPRRLAYQQDLWGYYNDNATGHRLPKLNYSTWWGETYGSGLIAQNLETFGSTNTTLPFIQTYQLDGNGRPITSDLLFESNRNPHFPKTQAGVLTEVIFPTGAKRSFTYELNKDISGVNVGGLRIKFIDNYADVKMPIFERTEFQYQNGYRATPTFVSKEIWDNDRINKDDIRKTTTLSSESMNFIHLTKGGPIGYGKVIESRSGQGSTHYTFKTPNSIQNISTTKKTVDNALCNICPSYAPQTEMDHFRGLLEQVEVKDSQGKNLQKTIFNYTLNPQGFTPSVTFGMKPFVRFQLNNLVNPIESRLQFGEFYGYRHDWVSLTSKTEEIYDQSDPGNDQKKLITVSEYHYLPAGQVSVASDLLPRKIYQTLPGGDKQVQEFKYPMDYTVSSGATDVAARGIFYLKDKKIENAVVENISYLEKTDGSKNILSGNLLQFREFPASSGKIYPWQVFRLKPGTGSLLTSFPWSTINSDIFTFNSAGYKLIRSFTSYDASGNALNQISEDGVKSDYVWGHNSSLLTQATTNAGMHEHRMGYTHTPLVGVIKITDPNLRDTKFNYDGFSRLNLIRDHNDQIETRYRYNYKDEALKRPDFTYTQINNQMFRFDCIRGVEPGSKLSWDLGNGNVVEDAPASLMYSYPSVGQFTVTLCITYPDNPTATVSKQLVILPPVNIQFATPVTGVNYTVCGTANVTVVASATGSGPYTFQWEHNYSAWGTVAYEPIGNGSTTLTYNNQIGVQSSSRIIRCKITDTQGFSRYSNNVNISYYCSGQPGPTDCGPGCYWDPIAGNCNCQSTCGDGCFWSGFECVCY
jgi:hypothetical protein